MKINRNLATVAFATMAVLVCLTTLTGRAMGDNHGCQSCELYVGLYESNKDYLELILDARDAPFKSTINSAIVTVTLTTENGESLTRLYPFWNGALSPGLYKNFIAHSVENVKKVKPGEFSFDVEPLGGKVDDQFGPINVKLKATSKRLEDLAVSLSNKPPKLFFDPPWIWFRPDWCLHWASDCGRPAAERFCKMRDLKGPVKFKKQDDVGLTLVQGDRRVCDNPGCDSFEWIKCGRNMRIQQPINPYRVDWCAKWATDCGQPAADLFCKEAGFQGAKRFSKAEDVGITFVAGDRRVCENPGCDSFDWIECD